VDLIGVEAHGVPRAQRLGRLAGDLEEPDALGHVDGLPERVRVPRGARARREVHAEQLDVRAG